MLSPNNGEIWLPTGHDQVKVGSTPLIVGQPGSFHMPGPLDSVPTDAARAQQQKRVLAPSLLKFIAPHR